MSTGRRLKRIFIGTALVLLAAVAVTGIWLYTQVRQHLTPPPDPAGQPSIATYAQQATAHVSASGEPPAHGVFDWAAIDSPPKSARPWTRWWWPGGDVDAATLTQQIAVLDNAGFGGAEVQPFISGMIAVADDATLMQRVYRFDSPAYYQALDAAATAAVDHGLQLDLTHFSGWPAGGPEVNLEDSLTMVAYGEATVHGGSDIELELPLPRPGPGPYIFSMIEFAGTDFINFPVEHARLLSVVAARATSGEHALNPFNLNDTVALDEHSLLVITDKVHGGLLHWQAPEGTWTIVASYLMPSGEVPMGAAQKPQGFVVDHLRSSQVIGHYEYAYGERTGLPRHYGRGLRGFFNDSLEFRLQRMAVADILPEFRARRGYDLEPYLPAIYVDGTDNVYFKEMLGVHAAPEFRVTALDQRIRHDYQQTLSDLVIERFVETSADWAAARGLVSRGQSYGMDIDIVRALGANSIPETEQLWAGGADAGLKFASSAAALYGRPLTGAESFVWINREYTTTARRIKAAADKLFLAGINHIVYHGTPYPWTGGSSGAFGEEGWAPFSGPDNPAHFSSNISPANTALWPDIPALNTYIARSQNLLRQGQPTIDVLIYYPFLGFNGPNSAQQTSEALVAGALPDADPAVVATEDPTLTVGKTQLDRLIDVPPAQEDERAAWVAERQPLLQELDRRGISWGWVNDHALQTGLVGPGTLSASGGHYRAILLPDVDAIEVATLEGLQRLAAQGTPVFLAGRRPQRQPGFLDAEKGDQAVQQAVRELAAQGARAANLDAHALAAELATLSDNPVAFAGQSTIKRYSRLLGGGGSLHFLANQSAAQAELILQVPQGQPLWWFDAVAGTAWPALAEGGKLPLTFGGFESRFLVAGVPLPDALPQVRPAGMAVREAARHWALRDWTFESGDYRANWSELPDWRTVDALRHIGSGAYSHVFEMGTRRDNARYLLDLGLVQGSAAISVNGRAVGRASFPPFTVDITDALLSGSNRIDIEVLAPLRNVFVGRALAGDAHYRHMVPYRDSLVAAGLMGPVVLAESTLPAAPPGAASSPLD